MVTAYGTLGNAGKRVDHTTLLTVKDRNGEDVIKPYVPPAGTPVVSPQAAYIVTDILAGNTNPSVNPFWGKFAIDSPDGRRPATLKTGTNNDAKDLNAYGYIAAPTKAARADGAYALAVGVWAGNSDNTPVGKAFSIEVTTYVWQGFLEEASKTWPIARFARPEGLTRVAIDPWTGLLADKGGKSVDEWFINNTQPKHPLVADTCGVDVLLTPDVGFESRYDNWMRADRDWIRRAEKGPGTAGGPERTRTAYFYNPAFHPYGRSWGSLVVGKGCGPSPSPTPSCIPLPTPDASGVIPSLAAPTTGPSGALTSFTPPEVLRIWLLPLPPRS